jgi:exodeoxyribonuclease V alpha subunit
MPITIENAKVKKIIFYNNQTHWGVFAMQYTPPNQKGPLKSGLETTVAGNFEGIYEGGKVNLVVEEVEHPKYGKQFQLQHFTLIEDNSSKEAIINFLTKSSINGIHKALAQKIYDRFKSDSIDIVLHHTEKLKEINGIGEKTYNVVKESVSAYFQMEELLQYCAKIGLNKFALTMQLYKEFGDKAVKMLQENPYQLLVLSEALTFNQVDEIAMKAGIKADDDNRLKFGLLYVLNRESVLQGSTGCADMQLKRVFLKTLGIQNNQLYRYAITNLEKNGEIYRDEDNVYLSAFWNAEKNIAQSLSSLNHEIPNKFEENIIKEEIHNFPFVLNDDQVKAIYSCLTHQFSIITSLAGCGKSTISKAILNILSRHRYNINLIAPTAKAAKRLAECTGYQAQTIHRFLKIKDSTLSSYDEVVVPRNALILIDEASMVDVRLFEKVLDVVKSDTRIILVGDTHQLPSVQAGNLLEDIILSGKFNICYLRDITRQAEDSNIIKYSNMVNDGQMIPQDLHTHDLVCTACQKTQRPQAIKMLKNAYSKAVEKYGLLNVQLICAYKQGDLGVNNLNKELRASLGGQIDYSSDEEDIFPFKVGDKVRHTINNYDLDVFNGETGVVQSIQKAEDFHNLEGKDLMIVDFGDRMVTYDKFSANELTLSYASTVHASQGSEYDCVFVVLDNEISNILLVRKIVYTAITRAKKKCYILSVGGCVNTAISNNHYKERLTKLQDFIKEESGEVVNEYSFN